MTDKGVPYWGPNPPSPTVLRASARRASPPSLDLTTGDAAAVGNDTTDVPVTADAGNTAE